MRVRVVGFGSNWWSAHPSDAADPFCFRRGAAWFNSAGLLYGNRLRLCWVYPGQVRFNQTSGFNPEFRNRIVGCTVECNEPTRMHGRTHLLVTRILDVHDAAERYLVAFNERNCGAILFNMPNWKSADVRLISASVRRERYEILALMGPKSRIHSRVGVWSVGGERGRLELNPASSGGR